jgi:transketolase N-terminal domain/subunit
LLGAETVCGALGAGLAIVIGLFLARRHARHAEKS